MNRCEGSNEQMLTVVFKMLSLNRLKSFWWQCASVTSSGRWKRSSRRSWGSFSEHPKGRADPGLWSSSAGSISARWANTGFQGNFTTWLLKSLCLCHRNHSFSWISLREHNIWLAFCIPWKRATKVLVYLLWKWVWQQENPCESAFWCASIHQVFF